MYLVYSILSDFMIKTYDQKTELCKLYSFIKYVNH